MRIDLAPGKYVVAVSGGVDSMVLLNLLARRKDLQLVVAHFDHGQRPDSVQDRQLVERVAKSHGLPFRTARVELGPQASEAAARAARYTFLHGVMDDHGAKAIITAHHQDDLLETAIINLLRGTGRLGLSSLRSRANLLRPLLGYSKDQLRQYALENGLDWREDSTNADDRYLRNYIRHKILPRFDAVGRTALLARLKRASLLNQELDKALAEDLAGQPGPDQLDRGWFRQLPHAVAKEFMAAWLRRNGVRGFDQPLIERLVVAAKTQKPGKRADVDAKHQLGFTKGHIKLIIR